MEAPLDRQQIQNDQKCIFTFYKNTIELLKEYYLCLVMIMDTVQMVCYVLADNEED